MIKKLQPHIMCKPGDIAPFVILSGDPSRVEKISTFFDERKMVGNYRGYITYTGKLNGFDITAATTGIGGPSAAIVVEELANLSAKVFIRVGTAGGLRNGINTGDILIVKAAIKSDGTSVQYLDKEFPAVSDFDIYSALQKAAATLKKEVKTGVVLTTDLYYSKDLEFVSYYGERNVEAVEMECSTLFTISFLRGLKSGAIVTIDGNLKEKTKKEDLSEEKMGELSKIVQNSIEDEIKIALKAIEILSKK